MQRVIYAILLLILTSCAGSGYVTRDAVQVIEDPYSDSIQYAGVTNTVEGTMGDLVGYNSFLRTWANKETGEVSHQLYIDINYFNSDWIFFSHATFIGGTPAELTQINREVITCTIGGCGYNEVVGIDFTTEELRSLTEGTSLKLYSESGYEEIVEIRPDQVNAQLATIKN
ncbi:MAG: hypothetical protein WEA36_10750 [Balneolaceae bacterium]